MKELKEKVTPSATTHAVVANGENVTVTGEIVVPLEIANIRKHVRIIVIPSIPSDCILGLDIIRLFGMKIDAQRDTYTLADLTDEKEIAFDLWSIGSGNKVDIASCGLSQITDEK